MKRIFSLDTFRGLALIFVVLFHSAVFNFANIDKLDFSNPPIVVVLISFLVLWGGIFIVYSSLINTSLLISRFKDGDTKTLFKIILLTGLLLLVSHYLLTIALGRWNIDFVHNQPNLSIVAGSVRHMKLVAPVVSKYFEGSSLSIISINMIVISSLILFLSKNGGLNKDRRNYLILGSSGLFIMLCSFIRIQLFPMTEMFISHKQYPYAWLFSLLIANPYPVIPYLAYGLFGAMLGLMLYKKQYPLIKKIIIPFGVLFFIYGLVGMTQFEKTISKADYFWYFKTQFELGIFLISMSILSIRFSYVNKRPTGLALVPYWFSRVCLTVYLFETLLSEILRYPMFMVYPSWDQTIKGCLIFGGVNVAIWVLILFLWKRFDFKYSLEYFWIKLFNNLGKYSTKLDDL